MTSLLAQQIDRAVYLRSMHRQFSQPNPHLWWEILLGVALVVGVVGIALITGVWQQRRMGRGEIAPLSLYRRVLLRMGLSWGDKWRLWRLSRNVKMAHPTALLLSAELFDEAVAVYCSGRGWLFSRTGARPAYIEIRRRLFTA